MFVRERRGVRKLKLCDREMFGDMMLVRQNPPTMSLPIPIPPPAVTTPCRRRTTSSASFISEDLKERRQNERRRTSQLIDELLLDIYNRDNCSSLSGYTSATSSLRSQKSFHKSSEFDLRQKDPKEVTALREHSECHVARMGSVLVRKLKRRDALRRQRDAHCDVISDHLRKRVPEAADMRFSIEPAPGDSGFSQWQSAMRMVAQLPGGIPSEFRRKLWLNLAERHLSSRNVNWPKVERECFSEWSHPADAELGVQIVKDLHRTGCSLFCGEDGQENQALLKRVLLAYARWNKAVGYCQGFNMLAALILQVTEKCESEALKLMIFLIEGVLPESYFADSLRGLSVDMAVFRELLKTRLPRLSRHLDTLQTAAKDGTTSYEPPLTNVFTMQWFLTLFCNCLPQPTVLRVWDLILLEGNEILLRTALAIWQALAEKILAVRSADEFYCIMGVLTREILEFGIVDPNALIKAIVTIGPLQELPVLREKYLYNINPWGSNVSSNVEAEVRNRQLKVYGRERLALDISALKKQYSKLKQRQRQAHIIFSAAVARQTPPNVPVVAMNHLLLGKCALIPARRIGPPKGAIPPVRQAPSTLLWKDAPPRQASSSSSSSDTELCDDPEDPEDVSPIPKSPQKSQFQDDNLIKSASDNLNLMKPDNTRDDFKLSSEDAIDVFSVDPSIVGESEINFDTGQIVDASAVDNNQITNVEFSDIFDTTASTKKDDGEFFDFSKYGIQSDSEDEGFDFEKFLENRVRCLKQTSVDDDSIASSSEDSSEYKRDYTRKNSQRALEIIQENSLILHRILQCQTRLTPSPPIQELQPPDNTVTACLADELSAAISKRETTTGTPDASVSPQLYYSDVFLLDNTTDIATGSIKYSTYENSSSPKQKYNPRVDDTEEYEPTSIYKSGGNNRDYNIEGASFDIGKQIKSKYQDEHTPADLSYTYKIQSFARDSPSEDQNIYETSKAACLEFDELKISTEQGEEEESNKAKGNYYDNDLDLQISNKDKDSGDDSESRPNFASILDSEYSRTLEEKYENLILKSSRPRFLDVAASFEKSDSSSGSSSYRCSISPVNKIESPSENTNLDRKSPNSENSIKKSPGDGSNFVRSPTSGRIYNPFPVNISSRQNKDVAFRLGLYKKS